jgi:hypothetical protein
LFFLLVWGVYFLIIALIEAPWRENKPGGWGFLLPLTFGSVMLLAFVYGVIRLIGVTLIPPRFRGVYTFTNGLALSHRDRLSVVPFDRIVAVWDEGGRFQTLDNELIEWPHTLEKSHILAEMVMRETAQRLTDSTNAALDAGESVAFGPLLISREGIAIDAQRVAWDELIYVFVEKEYLFFLRRSDVIDRADGLLRIISGGQLPPAPCVLLVELPNQHILWPILERLRPGVLESKAVSSEQQTQAAAPAAAKDPEAPLGVYRTQVGEHVPTCIKCCCVFILGLGIASVGAHFQWGDRSWYSLFWSGLILLGIGFVSLGVIGLWVCLRKMTTQVSLYADGFAYTRGRSRIFCRWEEIREGRWRSWGTFPFPEQGLYYDITTSSGKRLTLEKGLEHCVSLVDYIQKVLVPIQLPGVLDQFYAGETIRFPYSNGRAVVISLDGLQGHGWAVEWEEISGAKWQDGDLRIKWRGSRRAAGEASSDQMINSHLIVPLIEEVLRRRHWESDASR